MGKTSARRGRPTKIPNAGERVSLGLRVTADLKRKLDAAAQASGRSQSQEAEFRIERSFLDQHLMVDALELTYDRELAGILLVLGETMKVTGRLAGFMETGTADGSQNWWNHPYAYRQASEAAATLLEAMKPPGEVVAPAALSGRVAGLDLDHIATNFGRTHASSMLREIASEEPVTGDAVERAPRLRRALGSLAKRIKERIARQS